MDLRGSFNPAGTAIACLVAVIVLLAQPVGVSDRFLVFQGCDGWAGMKVVR